MYYKLGAILVEIVVSNFIKRTVKDFLYCHEYKCNFADLYGFKLRTKVILKLILSTYFR